ncbi:MAG TPA: hypothetical protein VGC13_24110 [Longimicrobium sp.]|jgi:hypothetical protein|uniref:hypothetical protein n=1 Tax=Longimicrobium sp. TaxID=2029185 RepID=UPI002ED8C2DB
MDIIRYDCFGDGPLFDQPTVLAILSGLFLLFVWCAVRRPPTLSGGEHTVPDRRSKNGSGATRHRSRSS